MLRLGCYKRITVLYISDLVYWVGSGSQIWIFPSPAIYEISLCESYTRELNQVFLHTNAVHLHQVMALPWKKI